MIIRKKKFRISNCEGLKVYLFFLWIFNLLVIYINLNQSIFIFWSFVTSLLRYLSKIILYRCKYNSIYTHFPCDCIPLCVMWQNINIYNFAHRKMSLTLSPFVVVYQIRAYAVIPHREREREVKSVIERERAQSRAVIFCCFVGYLYASQVLSTKCCL